MDDFKCDSLENFPYLDEGFDSVTEYQMICKTNEKLDDVIDETNKKFEEIETDFVNKEYVDLQDGNILKLSKDYTDNQFNELNQRILDNFDEINQLTGEVSDVKEQQGLFKQEQTLQNKAIQKNVDDIIETHTRIDRNSKRIENVETALYKKGEASGEFINIQDSALSEVKDIKASINKAQDTTEGYNIWQFTTFNDNSTERTLGGITAKIVEDGIILNGTSTERVVFYFNNNDVVLNKKGNVTIKQNSKSGEFFLQWYIFVDDKPGYYDTRNDQIRTINFEKSLRTDGAILVIENGITIKDFKLKSQMYEGTGDKPYEPYTGGIPAPNPNYPREIAKQSGVVEITSTGKNLLNPNNTKNITIGPNGEDIPGTDRLTSDFIKVKPTTNIYFSFETMFFWGLAYYNKNKDYIGREIRINKFIIPENCEYIKVFTQPVPNTIMTPELLEKYKVMIEIGDKATPYEPYQAITEKVDLKENVMLPFDNLVRKINPSDGKLWWALEKNSGKTLINITGSDDFSKTYFYFSKPNDAKAYGTYKTYAICECGTNDMTFAGNGSTTYFAITLPIGEKTFEEVKALCDGKEVVYELATPQTIFLQPVQNFNMTYNPITNIFSNRVNLLLDVSYNRDFVYTIKNLQVDKDTLENQLKDLETRVLALENKPATINESEVIPNEDLRA